MSTDNKVKKKIVEEYCERHPLVGDRPLARMIYNDNKVQYRDQEQVYEMIRYKRGHKGNRNRKDVKNKYFIKPLQTESKYKTLPKSYTEYPEKWYLPKASKKVLVLSDIHIPYHDVDAINAALDYGKQQGIDTIYLNGDIADFYMISQHQKDARFRPSMKQELEMCQDFFAYLRQEFPKVNIYFKPGNHEYRLERYLILKAPELLGCEEFELDILLKLREYGILYLKRRTKKIGRAHV